LECLHNKSVTSSTTPPTRILRTFRLDIATCQYPRTVRGIPENHQVRASDYCDNSWFNLCLICRQTETDPIRVPDNTSSTGFSCYQIIVNSDPSDNPMQAEICSCMGAAANYPCRKCKVGGNKQDKATDEGYHAMFSVSIPLPIVSDLRLSPIQVWRTAFQGHHP
jgi:hypothetical protein